MADLLGKNIYSIPQGGNSYFHTAGTVKQLDNTHTLYKNIDFVHLSTRGAFTQHRIGMQVAIRVQKQNVIAHLRFCILLV